MRHQQVFSRLLQTWADVLDGKPDVGWAARNRDDLANESEQLSTPDNGKPGEIVTARMLRLLADSLENEFMTAEDRKAWVTALRGDAKSLEWQTAEYVQRLDKEECRMLVTFLAAAAAIISVICGFLLGFRWDDASRLIFYRSLVQAMTHLRH